MFKAALRWLGGKVVDAWIVLVIGPAIGFAYWLAFDSLSPWSGWRAVGIGLSLTVAVTGLIVVYKQVHGSGAITRRQRKAFERIIAALDPAELAVLQSFEGRNTRELSADHPAIAGLRAKGILVLASSTGQMKWTADNDMHQFFCMMISPLAQEILRKRETIS